MNNSEKRKPTDAQLESIRAKRTELKELSKPFKKLVEIGEISTINEGLTALYSEQGHKDLKTLKQWNKEGKSVIKGEHALLLWGKPKAIGKPEATTEATESEEDAADFYPICFVFSALQVHERRAAA